MATELDRTQQRIIGVLIEKELAVPESYPLTENALIQGCNQKNNRDPEMALEAFEVSGALNALMTDGWARSATSTGGYATRYAHRLESNCEVGEPEKAVLCELLVRGPQAPGALKPRIARLGCRLEPAAIEAVLRGMAERPIPLVAQLPRRPRERDHRWRHLLGPMDPAHEAAGASDDEPGIPRAASRASPASPAPPAAPAAAAIDPDLVLRLERLEAEVARLTVDLRRLREEL